MSEEGLPGPMEPLVAEWFLSRYGRPTPVQLGVWEALGRGEQVLALAPTGNGKTLAAFLLALSRLVEGSYPATSLSVLYVSPLKALNEDIRRNLLEPLAGIGALAAARGRPLPELRAETRSGDSSEQARRRFLTRPPSILCTTPESLAILLDSPRARPVLASIRFVIVDEIHAMAGTKRGAHLASSLGRLALLAGEFQRVALSATLRPAERIASWFGALRLEGEPGSSPLKIPRPVRIVAPPLEKDIEFRVSWPRGLGGHDGPSGCGGPSASDGTGSRSHEAGGRAAASPAAAIASRYEALVPAILERIGGARTTLVFCDARRRAEKLAYLLNEEAQRRGAEEAIAWAHHGSLSREIRESVETRLKAGALPAVVATASLELGIDVGEIEQVLLAGSPPSIAQALQRAGRSGHGVGLTSRVELLPFHGIELLTAAALVREARQGRIEETRPQEHPLDLLVQVLLSLVAEEARSPEALFDIVTSFAPFIDLPRPLFDACLELLEGKWAPAEGGARPRELEARAVLDPATGLVHELRGSRRLLWTSGGTIPDRGLFSLRLAGEGKRIGELDEEFVFERKPGDAFTLGSQAWRIVEIGAEAVSVVPLDRPADFVPFWKGGPLHASPELARGLLDLVELLRKAGPAERRSLLAADCGFSEEAAEELCSFLDSQEAAQAGLPLPGEGLLLVEGVEGRLGAESDLVLVHSLRGGRINEGLAFLLGAALAEEGLEVQTQADNEGLLLISPGAEGSAVFAERVLRLLRSLGGKERVEALLRARLEASGLFAAAFRENAGRALLLPRGFGGRRQPLWRSRLRASRLFAAVSSRPDFPVTLETWRSVLQDSLDLEGLVALAADLASGRVGLAAFRTSSHSPFASGAAWAAESNYMYRDDQLPGGPTSVSSAAIALALESAAHRPLLEPALVADFVRKRKRLLPGWAPAELPDLLAWVGERLAIPLEEYRELLRLGGLEAEPGTEPGPGARFEILRLPGAGLELVTTAERREELLGPGRDFLAEWLRFEGPLEAPSFSALFGIPPEELVLLAETLVEEGSLVLGTLVRGGGEALVDRENYEILLRIGRARARPSLPSRPAAELSLLFQRVQGLGPGAPARSPAQILEGLAGYPAPFAAWRDQILPLRLGPDWLSALDELLSAEGWLWFGTGRESLAFADAWNYELFAQRGLSSALLEAGAPPRDFWSLREGRGGSSRSLALELWKEAWEGRISSDSFSPLVKAAAGRFGRELPDEEAEGGEGGPAPGSRGRRLGSALPPSFRHRWRRGAPVEGLWSPIGLEEAEGDAADEDELDRARVRVLLGRYGILFRSLLERELGSLSWSRLFPALRRMELAGELVAGYFFEDLPAPQFLGSEGLALFRGLEGGGEARPLWLSALDPASPTGLGLPGSLPPRSASASLCLVGARHVATSRRSGRALELEPGLDEEERVSVLKSWAASVGKLRLESLDGRPAADSPLAPLLLTLGFEKDRGSLHRW